MTNPTSPKVSVIICTYNRAGYISAAIKSVLEQTYTNWELLILDDASTDTTETIVADFIKMEVAQGSSRITYIRNEKNLGIAANRNAALAKARGKYVAMLDSDDIWISTEKLAKQVAFLEAHQHDKIPYALVGSWMKKIDPQGKTTDAKQFCVEDSAIRKQIFYSNQFAQSSVLIVKQAILDAGGYNTAYPVNEDYDIWLTLGTKYKFANIPEYMIDYRIHATNIMGSKRVLAAKLFIEIIKKHSREYPGYFGARIKAGIRLLSAYFLRLQK